MADLSVVLLHEGMHDKQGSHVTTSLTMIDLHDIARSCRTYNVTNLFVAHPSPTLRKLARTLRLHWEEGHGATYNPNRKEALSRVEIVSDLDEAIHKIDIRTGDLPTLVATSARPGPNRVTFASFSERIKDNRPYLLMLGTGHGMASALLDRAELFLEPINGPSDYNHLSVRSACAIMLDRILAN